MKFGLIYIIKLLEESREEKEELFEEGLRRRHWVQFLFCEGLGRKILEGIWKVS